MPTRSSVAHLLRRSRRRPCGRRTRTRSCGSTSRASSSAWSTCTIGASFAAYADRVLDHRGSATIVVCGTETARSSPLRSKMLPRSAGMATVRTRCPTPSDDEVRAVARLEVEEAHADGGEREHGRRARCRARAPGWAAADGPGARFGCVVVRGRAGAGRPARATVAGRARGAGAARVTGTRAAPRAGRRAGAALRRAPRGSRLLGAKARLRLRPVGDRVGGRSVVGRGHRRVRHVEVRRRARAAGRGRGARPPG